MLLIELYTLQDCEGCKVLKKNVEKLIEIHEKLNITLNEIDVTDKTKKYLKQLNNYKIYDFPAMLFIKDGMVVLSDYGSRPYAVLQRYIDLYFKH